MIEKGLYALLAGTAGVTAIVGTRIYPNHAPQKADLPHVVYRRVTNEPRRHLRGSSRLKRALLQVDCFGVTYESAKAVSSAVYAAIGEDGYAGTWDSQTVQLAYWDEDGDSYIAPQTKDDAGKHQVSLDLVVWYKVA